MSPDKPEPGQPQRDHPRGDGVNPEAAAVARARAEAHESRQSAIDADRAERASRRLGGR